MLVKPPFFGRPKDCEIAKAQKPRKPVENEKENLRCINQNSPLCAWVNFHFTTLITFSAVQKDATLLANNSRHCWMIHVASVCTSCCMLLRVVAQSLKPVKLLNQRLPTILFFRDRRRIRLHSSSNILEATHAHHVTWSPVFGLECAKSFGLYPSHDALQVPTLGSI